LVPCQFMSDSISYHLSYYSGINKVIAGEMFNTSASGKLTDKLTTLMPIAQVVFLSELGQTDRQTKSQTQSN